LRLIVQVADEMEKLLKFISTFEDLFVECIAEFIDALSLEIFDKIIV
jgi:hypothetical protein